MSGRHRPPEDRLLVALWGFKAWVEMALDDGTIVTTDEERTCLRWLLRRIERIQAERDAAEWEGGRS